MSKFAIIETGGKQYVVAPDATLTIEKLDVSEPGAKVVFDKVLLVDDGKETKVGAPYVAGAKVSGELIVEGRAKKVVVIRYKQKSRYFRKKGHRQPFAKVKITAIS